MSGDFFNQPFSQEQTGIKSRPNAKPPPPPRNASASKSGSSNAPPPRPRNPISNNGGYYANKTSEPSKFLNSRGSNSSAGNFSGSRNSIITPKVGGSGLGPAASRPTGNYYPTAPSGDSKPASAAFPAYNPYGANTNSATTTNEAPGIYNSNTLKTGNLDSLPTTPSNEGDDWFSSAQNEDRDSQSAPNSYMNNTAVAGNPNKTAAPAYMNPYAGAAVAKPEENSQPLLRSESMEMPSGSMSGPMSFSNPNMNNFSMPSGADSSPTHGQYDFENEPPLLEELGINLSHIQTKSLAVMLPVRYAKSAIDKSIMEDNDLAGPLAFGLLLAVELLLSGKIHFGYIYGFGLFGCIAMTLMLNLMSPTGSMSIWTVVSILGYCLLPVNMLAAVNVFYRIKYMNSVGVILAALTIGWCTISSTRLVERGFGMRDQSVGEVEIKHPYSKYDLTAVEYYVVDECKLIDQDRLVNIRHSFIFDHLDHISIVTEWSR
eukprot:scaffold10559_cov267-Chaetoceros_neogracile.AAC.5